MRKIVNALQKIYTIFNRKQKVGFVFLLVATLVAAVFETLGVTIIIPLINAMLQPETIYNSKYGTVLANLLGITSSKEMALTVVLFTIVLYIFKNLYFSFFSWAKIKFSCRTERELSLYMLQSYMNRGYQFFASKNTNYVIQGVRDDVYKLYQIINSLLFIVTKFFIILLICVFMFVSDWQMALIVMVTSGCCLLFLLIFFRKRMKQVGIQEREIGRKADQILLQTIQGMKEVLVLRKQKQTAKTYNDTKRQSQEQQIKRQLGTDLPNYIIEGVFVSVILVFLAFRMAGDRDNVGFIAILASFAVGAFRIMPALGNISSSLNSIIANIPSLNAIYENVIDARKNNIDFYKVDAEDNPLYSSNRFADKVILDNITFSYSDELGDVIRKLYLEISKGSSIGIVGASGAGKSTLADIILGVLYPSSGNIYMDGISIREIPNLWSRTIGFVPQSIYLTDSSVKGNVAFGVEESDIDDSRVINALKKANIYEFVMSLPKGIEEEIGERGVRLSGGQRQRIGIARALYHEPDILVLDEATSALDNDTEKTVMEAIETLQGSMTLIIIAHRLTTIRNCDKIYEIVNGQAVLRKYEELE